MDGASREPKARRSHEVQRRARLPNIECTPSPRREGAGGARAVTLHPSLPACFRVLPDSIEQSAHAEFPPRSLLARPKRRLGAGFQWWYPNFCPAFVLCLAFVQHMSSICLNFVLVKHLSNICPKKPTFVLGKSNICLHSPTYVPLLSSDFVKNQQKIEGQNLVISWTCQFLHLASGHTAVGQKLDNMWT